MTMDTSACEQFRATKVWNTIVSAVKQELPVGKKRRGLKSFDNCFSGTDAVTWTLNYLKKNKDLLSGSPEVTREKVTLLLQKFIEQKIVLDVRGRGGQFKDSSAHLYAFNKENVAPISPEPSNLQMNDRLRSSSYQLNQVSNRVNLAIPPTSSTCPDHHPPIPKPLISQSFFKDLPSHAKTLLLHRLCVLFPRTNLSSFVLVADYAAKEVCHNVYKVSSSGIVLPSSKADDIPAYIMQAMKCLAKWPLLSQGYPAYPGFLNDVLKVVLDFFRGKLLLPRALYELSMVAFASVMPALQEPEGPISIRYETAFVTANPETKILPRTARKTPLQRYISTTPGASLPRSELRNLAVRAATVRRITSTVGCYVNSAFSSSSSSLSSGVSSVSDVSARTCKDVQVSKDQVMKQLQHLYLLLSTGNRRALHLLLRFIYKVGQNNSLLLKEGRSNHDVLVDTFSTCLVGALRTNLQQTSLFMTFLVDNCDIIFAVPESFKQDLDSRIGQV